MPLYFTFGIHNHQPVGNFGFVMEEAYTKAYLPFQEVFQSHPSMKITLHFSGVLYRWFEENHPEFLEAWAELGRKGKVEFLAGGFYEPLLTQIPEEDRRGQLSRMTGYLRERFGQEPKGLWLAERAWEPHLPGCIRKAGLEYVVMDDFHLRAAGAPPGEITRPYTTGDGEAVLSVVGGSEKLRYIIPFEEPEKTIAYLHEIHTADPEGDQLVTMADDGEKFGIWPGTHRLVYQEGWMDRFFGLLHRNRDWLKVVTYSEALELVEPGDPLYIPAMSYMEMGEWTLDPKARKKYQAVTEMLDSRDDLGYTKHLVRGGFWRNFLTRYPESRYMTGRMHWVSRNVHGLDRDTAADNNPRPELLAEAREELWQGQCNDAYWHGIFGGIYLPFLRAAVYRHLIRAEVLVERVEIGKGELSSMESFDLDGDGRDEVLLRNRRLTLTADPRTGLGLELALKPAGLNLFNSMSRREEGYHRQPLEIGLGDDGEEVRSIHTVEDREAGATFPSLDYDEYPRKSLVDHLWWGDYSYADWCRGLMTGGWKGKKRFHQHRWGADRSSIFLDMISLGEGPGLPGHTKRVSLDRDAPGFSVRVTFETGEGAVPFYAGQEFNLTPTSLEECLLEIKARGEAVRELTGQGGEYRLVELLRLTDGHLPLTLEMIPAEPLSLWVFPLETVSKSEAGYERNLQQVALMFWREFTGRKSSNTLDIRLNIDF
jgi:alpha-amylase